jgi:antitoxin (DNA-binding transcriptional repressor) of toxin-antitoxin stability system
VIDRVEQGDRLTVTPNGREVAKLRRLEQPSARASELVERWRRLRAVDPGALLADLDQAVDSGL